MNKISTSKKFMAVAFFGVFIFCLWSFFLKSNSTEEIKVSDQEKTKVRAELVAKKLIDMKFKMTSFVTPPQKRRVASEVEAVAATRKADEGQYGRDAWGYPMHFKVKDGKVFVWSLGENHQQESSADEIIQGLAKGDDIAINATISEQ